MILLNLALLGVWWLCKLFKCLCVYACMCDLLVYVCVVRSLKVSEHSVIILIVTFTVTIIYIYSSLLFLTIPDTTTIGVLGVPKKS